MRGAVESDVNALFLLLGGVALLVGALGIANVTLLSVLNASRRSAYAALSVPPDGTSRSSSWSRVW